MKIYSLMLASLLGTSVVNAAHWGYGEHNGPHKWGAHYPQCNGKEQSPINILTKTARSTTNALKVAYKADSKNIINNGHSVQVNFTQKGGISYQGKDYKLVQLHFHTPSENTIDNVVYPLEMHLVHSNAEGGLLVIGVLFEEGRANAELQKIIVNAPAKSGGNNKLTKLNPQKLLPKTLAYYAFDGSLTTPPCSQNVQWVVLQGVLSASKRQIDVLHRIMHDNSRDVQPLNGREIQSAQ
ncbi:carbonic anhydrase [uncultured Helicobacter sp.]|uniref:carbonic anhydrase n=1 Tax=uncultured Helicobacter sp. TaxID=175537 RepID=UPI001C3BE23E|nr:carbonic anhydrase family protein [Candidatus Helicobacter avicola]